MNKMVTTFAPQSLSEAREFSKELAASGLVPECYRNKPTDILVAIQWGYELNLQPLQALQNITVMKGKPTVWGDTLLSLVVSHPAFAGCDETVANNIATCTVKRKTKGGIQETVRTFSKQDAEVAELWSKRGPWQTYPKRMLQMRARGFALRDAFPDALKGVISTEEAMDHPEPEIKNIHPHAFEETDTFKQIKDVLPNASVVKVEPKGSFLKEHHEKWQTIEIKFIVELLQSDEGKIKCRDVLRRWMDEAEAVFNLCQTQEDFVEAENRFNKERIAVCDISQHGEAWAEKCRERFQPFLEKRVEEIADRMSAQNDPEIVL